MVKVAEHVFSKPQSSVTLKFTVTVPPHKSGGVKFSNPEVTKVPLPPEAVKPCLKISKAASTAA
ncbi:hypothetical protein D3C87_1012240 [compost metagenome]